MPSSNSAQQRPAAIAAPSPVAQPKRARTQRAGGAAGPQTLPETLDQGHERRVHGAGGSGGGRTCLSAPPELVESQRLARSCTGRHVTLLNTPMTRPRICTSVLLIGSKSLFSGCSRTWSLLRKKRLT